MSDVADITFVCINGMAEATIQPEDLLVLRVGNDDGEPLKVLAIVGSRETAEEEGWLIMRATHSAAPGERVTCVWEKGKRRKLSQLGRYRAFLGLYRLQGRSLADIRHAREGWEKVEEMLWGTPE